MKHLKKFDSLSEYNTFVIGESYVLPNVSWIVDTDEVKYQSIIKMKPGDVVYYNNGLKTVPLEKYSADLGTAVGVVTIPNFTGDIVIEAKGIFNFVICLVEGTEILLADGTYKKIEDVEYIGRMLAKMIEMVRYQI